MADLQSFKIESSVHDYEVEFDDFRDSITKIANPGDFLIIDGAVARLESLEFLADKESIGCNRVYIPPAETSKEYIYVYAILNRIIESGFRRGNKIIAIGGGVTQDISGFIASMLYRGVDWVFYPTTLLSQGDSCIGGKTSINVGKYKNQVGGFYPPNQIIIDIKFLETLPKNQITSGLGEMAHYFFIEGGEDFDFFRELNFKDRLEEIILRSLKIKKKMIELDEFDNGPRIIFNYGHSFGHALESITNYKIPHGIAVAYGMDMANFVSYKLGFVDEKFVEDALYILKEFFGSWEIRKIMIDIADDGSYISEKLIPTLKCDKKNRGDKLGLILTKGFGDMFLEYITPDEIEIYLKDYFKERYGKYRV